MDYKCNYEESQTPRSSESRLLGLAKLAIATPPMAIFAIGLGIYASIMVAKEYGTEELFRRYNETFKKIENSIRNFNGPTQNRTADRSV